MRPQSHAGSPAHLPCRKSADRVVDHLHPERAPEIKLAKDIAAGAVLVASVAAVIVGALMIVAVVCADVNGPMADTRARLT